MSDGLSGPVAREIRLCLRELHLVKARLDREKQIALFHLLPFTEIYLDQFAADLRLHLHRRHRFHIPDPAQFDRHILRHRHTDIDRYRCARLFWRGIRLFIASREEKRRHNGKRATQRGRERHTGTMNAPGPWLQARSK